MIQILKSKVKELIVTQSDVNYPGSVAMPEEIMKAANIIEFELVHLNNITTGARVLTYAVKSGSRGRVTVDGAAASLFNADDKVHVFTFLDQQKAASFRPQLVIADQNNELITTDDYVIDHTKSTIEG